MMAICLGGVGLSESAKISTSFYHRYIRSLGVQGTPNAYPLNSNGHQFLFLGGKGGVHRTVVGILLLYVMYKGLGFLGLGGYMNTMVKGIVLLLVVSFDAFVTQSGTKKA